jgi:hypothetical protein
VVSKFAPERKCSHPYKNLGFYWSLGIKHKDNAHLKGEVGAFHEKS